MKPFNITKAKDGDPVRFKGYDMGEIQILHFAEDRIHVTYLTRYGAVNQTFVNRAGDHSDDACYSLCMEE